jgi:hypothetical protein
MKKRYYILIAFLILFFLFLLIVSQNTPQKRLEKIMNEEIAYSQFSESGFSIKYPQWPDTSENDVELTVTKGYCTVSVNSEKIPAKQWYDMFIDSIEKQSGEIIKADKNSLQIRYFLDINNNTLVSDGRIYECNDKSTAVTLTCIKEAEKVMQKLSNEIFPSADCQEKSIELKDYQEDDFTISYPDWEKITDRPEQRLVGVSRGICSVIVDKHNALPKDIFDWISKAIKEKDDHNLLDSSVNDDEYNLVYQFPHEAGTLTSTTKIFYCNYQSYLTQVICVDEYYNEHYEKIKNSVLESSTCFKKYEIPTQEKIEKEKQEVKETEPEVIEEIENEIVRTNAGDEFGIDEEMVVYFIINNAFFTKIMKDFPKANLLIEDKENNRELKLRVLINNDGKITLLEDGEYDDADVTLIVPLQDALNIFSNAQNINPVTLIAFAINVRTEPADIKNEVIGKVLRGEYN